MPTPNWIGYKEPTHGVNAEGYPDVSNRPCRTIWNNFTKQHEKDGTHLGLDPDVTMYFIAVGSYTGNSTDSRGISVGNVNLDTKFVRIFSAASAYSIFASASMTAGDALRTDGTYYNDWILSLSQGGFNVSDNAEVNQTGTTYYFVAYGPYKETPS